MLLLFALLASSCYKPLHCLPWQLNSLRIWEHLKLGSMLLQLPHFFLGGLHFSLLLNERCAQSLILCRHHHVLALRHLPLGLSVLPGLIDRKQSSRSSALQGPVPNAPSLASRLLV